MPADPPLAYSVNVHESRRGSGAAEFTCIPRDTHGLGHTTMTIDQLKETHSAH